MFKNLTMKEAVDPFYNQGTEHQDIWSMKMIMVHVMDYESRGFLGAW